MFNLAKGDMIYVVLICLSPAYIGIQETKNENLRMDIEALFYRCEVLSESVTL
jgi:hypothetical protein